MPNSIRNLLNRLVVRSAEEREVRQAIRELQAYSDRELNELGIGRGDIPEVVRHGRKGFGQAPRPTAARVGRVDHAAPARKAA